MTIQEFKTQLKKMGFNEDKTKECDDMLVNLAFRYPVSLSSNKWTILRCAVMFFKDNFRISIATIDNKRFNWSTWNRNLSNASNAGQVLFYGISDILHRYHPRLIIR